MTSLLLYPMKYLSEFFVPYGSFFQTNILSRSMSSILNSFLFFVEITFVDLFSNKFMYFPIILILGKKYHWNLLDFRAGLHESSFCKII